MRRTPAWAALALYPLLVTVLVGVAPESAALGISASGKLAEFVDAYWWLLLGAPAALATVFFLGHALARGSLLGGRRFVWVAGILLLGPVIVPAYWWFCSDAS